MKIVILLTIALLLAPFTAAQAVDTCPGAATSLIRVAFFREGAIGFYQAGRSVEFPALVTLSDQFTGRMKAVYTDPAYWQMSDGRRYYATVQPYPYLIEYYDGKYDGESECQYLIGISAEYPDLAFVYVYRDYWQQLARGVDVHPIAAYYMPLSALVGLLEAH